MIGRVRVVGDGQRFFVVGTFRTLSGAIARINDRYSGLKLNLRMSSPDQILASVLEGSADLGFTALIRPRMR